MTVYDRILIKSRDQIDDLNSEERDFLEKQLIEEYTLYVTRMTSEHLMQEASDKGLII